MTKLRGLTTRADGTVNIFDALFTAQYLVGLRPLGDDPTSTVNALNAAGPLHEVIGGDVINIFDALFIAQYLAGTRDSCFNWVGSSAPATAGGETQVGIIGETTTSEAAASSGAQVGNAAVRVDWVILSPGQEALLFVKVKDINDPDGLGAYDFAVQYDPSVAEIVEIVGGTAPFDGVPTQNIDNSAGLAIFNAFQTSVVPGPTGEIIVAYLKVKAVGAPWTLTDLDLTITSLYRIVMMLS